MTVEEGGAARRPPAQARARRRRERRRDRARDLARERQLRRPHARLSPSRSRRRRRSRSRTRGCTASCSGRRSPTSSTELANRRRFIGDARDRASSRRALRRAARARVRRPRRLQARQRQARPPGRRRGAARVRRLPAETGARDRRRRAARRRGVRGVCSSRRTSPALTALAESLREAVPRTLEVPVRRRRADHDHRELRRRRLSGGADAPRNCSPPPTPASIARNARARTASGAISPGLRTPKGVWTLSPITAMMLRMPRTLSWFVWGAVVVAGSFLSFEIWQRALEPSPERGRAGSADRAALQPSGRCPRTSPRRRRAQVRTADRRLRGVAGCSGGSSTVLRPRPAPRAAPHSSFRWSAAARPVAARARPAARGNPSQSPSLAAPPAVLTNAAAWRDSALRGTPPEGSDVARRRRPPPVTTYRRRPRRRRPRRAQPQCSLQPPLRRRPRRRPRSRRRRPRSRQRSRRRRPRSRRRSRRRPRRLAKEQAKAAAKQAKQQAESAAAHAEKAAKEQHEVAKSALAAVKEQQHDAEEQAKREAEAAKKAQHEAEKRAKQRGRRCRRRRSTSAEEQAKRDAQAAKKAQHDARDRPKRDAARQAAKDAKQAQHDAEKAAKDAAKAAKAGRRRSVGPPTPARRREPPPADPPAEKPQKPTSPTSPKAGQALSLRAAMTKRATVATLCALVFVTAAAASTSDDGKQQIHLTAADNAAARGVALRKADFGGVPGWSGGTKKPDLSSSGRAARTSIPKYSDLVLTGSPRASSRTPASTSTTRCSCSKTAPMVKLDWQRSVLAPGLLPCLRHLSREVGAGEREGARHPEARIPARCAVHGGVPARARRDVGGTRRACSSTSCSSDADARRSR